MELNKIIHGDCLEQLKKLPDNSIDCCVTSPPYFGLRDYGNDAQIGLEETPELFVDKLVAVFREVNRVLKPTGTLWLNLGDSYWGGKGMSGGASPEKQEKRNDEGKSLNKKHQNIGGHGLQRPQDGQHDIIKPKDLVGIPWMVAFALRADGWYLRQDIIWNKPAPMPESVTDRCTKSHEYIFLLSKSKHYYYDHVAIFEAANYDGRKDTMMKGSAKYANGYAPEDTSQQSEKIVGHERWKNKLEDGTPARNKRSVWTVNTSSYRDAHFATFLEELIEDCLKAGCPENGVVLDPFMGAGTTALVARKLNRNFVGIELNEKYIAIAEKRLQNELGMFN